jgi:hypothetical protein
MYANAALIAQFDQLTAPLMMSGLDLSSSIERQQCSAQLAVRSLLGWSITVRVDQANVTMTSIPPGTVAADVRASLRIPLSAFLTAGVGGGMIFYASAPHAFCRLAADFVPVLGPAVCLLRLDQDLNPSFTSGLSGAHLMSPINRAIALLMAAGDTADSARLRLHAAADADHLTLTQSARVLLTPHPMAPRFAPSYASHWLSAA